MTKNIDGCFIGHRSMTKIYKKVMTCLRGSKLWKILTIFIKKVIIPLSKMVTHMCSSIYARIVGPPWQNEEGHRLKQRWLGRKLNNFAYVSCIGVDKATNGKWILRPKKMKTPFSNIVCHSKMHPCAKLFDRFPSDSIWFPSDSAENSLNGKNSFRRPPRGSRVWPPSWTAPSCSLEGANNHTIGYFSFVETFMP